MMPALDSRSILGSRVDATSYADATARVLAWGQARESRYVCVCNVHMIMEAYDAPDYQQVVNQADLVTPDGVPLVWTLQRLGVPGQTRVYGPDLMLHVCAAAAVAKTPIGCYGGTPERLQELVATLQQRYPGLLIPYTFAPPFRPLTAEEDATVTREIAAAGVRILFVGLGCPKQERWMAEHRGRVPAVMLGVGAAFNFITGHVHQAPAWMQRLGLEWLFRLLMEPKRLWRRYYKHNSRFVVLILWQLFRRRG